MVTDGWYPYHWWLIFDIRIIDGWCINEHWNVCCWVSFPSLSTWWFSTCPQDFMSNACRKRVRGRLQARHLRQVQHAVCSIVQTCANNSQLVVVGLVLSEPHLPNAAAEVRHLWITYDTSTSSSDSNSQVPRRYSQLTAAFRTASGAPCCNQLAARSLGRLDCCAWFSSLAVSIRFYMVWHGLVLFCGLNLWVAKLSQPAISVTRVAKCGLLGIWRFYPCLFGIIMIGGPWWPRFAPFFSSGQHGSRALFLRSRLVSLRSDHVTYVCSQGECKPLHSTQSHAPVRPKGVMSQAMASKLWDLSILQRPRYHKVKQKQPRKVNSEFWVISALRLVTWWEYWWPTGSRFEPGFWVTDLSSL